MATPADLAGKTLWLRGKDLAGADGAAVTAWADQSGLAHDPTRFTSSSTILAGATPSGGKVLRVTGSAIIDLPYPLHPVSTAQALCSSQFNGNYRYDFLVDGVSDSSQLGWASRVAPTVAAPEWVRLQPATAKVVTQYRIFPQPGSALGRRPKDWTFEGSMDGDAWTVLDTRAGVTWVSGDTSKAYSFSNATPYTYYRISCTATQGNDILYLSEVTLNEEPNGNPASPGEMWLVVRATSTNSRAWALGRGSGGNYYPYTDSQVYDDFINGTRRSFTPTIPISEWRLLRVTLTAAGALTYRLDEAVQATYSGVTAAWPISPRLANQSSLDIAETLILTQPASTSEVAGLITYFNTEHGLTVPGGSVPAPSDYTVTGGADVTSGATANATVEVKVSGAADAVSDAEARASVPPPPDSTNYVVTGDAAATTDADALAMHGAAVSGSADVVSGAEGRATVPLAPDELEATSHTTFSATIGGSVDLELLEAEARTTVTSSAALSLDVTLDPVTQRPQYSLLVVDRTGQPLGELENARLGDITRTRNGRGSFSFTLPKDDPKVSLVRQFSEVQVWMGRDMVPGAWFVIVDPAIDDGTQWRYECSGIRWHLETRRIGRELPNLLKNGDFEEGTRYWHPRWFKGSAAEAPPKVTVLTGANALQGGRAIEVTGVEKVTKKTVQSDAIFIANRPYAGEPLANGFLSGGEKVIRDNIKNIAKGSAVTVEGHTADADAGTGYELSVRRAEAAKAVILAARPDLKVTAVGKGETEQVAPNDTEKNQAKNRRIVIIANITSVGHRQAETQRLYYTPPADVRRPGELRLNGWVNLIDYVGPSKDGWLLYLGARKVNAKKDEPGDQATSTIDEGFPVQRWTPDGVTLGGLKPGQTYVIDVRLYPTAGKTRFDRFSLTPNLVTAWYNKTRPEVIKGLVQHAQDPQYRKANVNIAANCKPFGARDDFEYVWEDRRTVDDCIADLLRGDGAPDFEVLVTPTRRVATTWANRGRRTHVPLKLGDIVTDYTSGIDGDKVASTAIVQSSRSRGSKSEAFARTTRSDGLVLERLFDAEQDTTDSVCAAQARAALRYGRTDVITSVTCDPARTLWLLERVDLADICPVQIPDAGLTGDGDYRIEEITLDPNRHQLTYRLAVEA